MSSRIGARSTAVRRARREPATPITHKYAADELGEYTVVARHRTEDDYPTVSIPVAHRGGK